ncbi:hypothetical protein CPHO_12025 [Corynebacterium phocae]|uniref:YbjN domain-containing protein n=1 Tax=Corynebacterium phocae TaxID=161895 RepID=A0A1L7D5Z3_9CORY|nr:YbjN domain-containing protein [Corynebacterium phocae]APT93497.1 hypothetical protein CPHO_12025 [Corynebacterium phocae]KAA8720577.1 YbjN domain-containing protein [Corynebacterium phocae]
MSNTQDPANRFDLGRVSALFDTLGFSYKTDDKGFIYTQVKNVVLTYASLGDHGELLSILAKPAKEIPAVDRPTLVEFCNFSNREMIFPKSYVIDDDGTLSVRTAIAHLVAPDMPEDQLQAVVRMSIETNLRFFQALEGVSAQG